MPSSRVSRVALVDTNVLSELIRPRPNAGVVAWMAGVERLLVSAVTVEEMAFGFALNPKPDIQAKFDALCASRIEVLPVTNEIARHAGGLRARLRRGGKVRTQADLLVAATAFIHQVPLATRNTRDFEGCSITLLNPFSGD